MMKAELCIDSYEGAKIAYDLGFDSVEINSSLYLGGITPGLGLVRNIAENLEIDTMVMVRNRPGGFNYTDQEFEEMKKELDIFLEEDIKGIVFGFITADFEIDQEKTKYFVDRIHEKGKKAIFHRAYDNTKDPYRSMELLIDLGVDRVLTSGQEETAFEGRRLLKNLFVNYGNDIEIIGGAGLNSSNIAEFIDHTGLELVHSTCKTFREDLTTSYKVSYSFMDGEKINSYQVVSKEEARDFIREVKN